MDGIRDDPDNGTISISFRLGGGWSRRRRELFHETGKIVRLHSVSVCERGSGESGQLWRLSTGFDLHDFSAEGWSGLRVFPVNGMDGTAGRARERGESIL